MKSILGRLAVVLIAGGLLATVPVKAGIIFTFENAGVQQTTVAGALTETFDSVPLGVVGTYTSPNNGGTYSGGQVVTANQYGGADGSGRYDVVGLGNTVSQNLTFADDKTYFGLWWSAGDPANRLEFYDGASLLGSFVIGDIIPFLSAAYKGNPNSGQNANEYYAYLNFTTTGGSTFDKVVFNNVTASGFESDNHSVYDQPIQPPGNPIPVPDAGSSISMLAGAVAMLLSMRRKSA